MFWPRRNWRKPPPNWPSDPAIWPCQHLRLITWQARKHRVTGFAHCHILQAWELSDFQILFSVLPIYEVTRYHKVYHLREIHLSSTTDTISIASHGLCRALHKVKHNITHQTQLCAAVCCYTLLHAWGKVVAVSHFVHFVAKVTPPQRRPTWSAYTGSVELKSTKSSHAKHWLGRLGYVRITYDPSECKFPCPLWILCLGFGAEGYSRS